MHSTQTKYVFLSTSLPEDCAKYAQVAIQDERSWHLIGPAPYRAHGDAGQYAMPEVTCPVVDIRPIPAEKDEAVMNILAHCIQPQSGVTDLHGLLDGLERLGAKIQFCEEVLQ